MSDFEPDSRPQDWNPWQSRAVDVQLPTRTYLMGLPLERAREEPVVMPRLQPKKRRTPKQAKEHGRYLRRQQSARAYANAYYRKNLEKLKAKRLSLTFGLALGF